MSERQPFGTVLRDLLIKHGYVTQPLGNPNWRAFTASLPDGILYETVRKAAAGERWPSAKIMEACAAQLGVEPTVFWEYQLWLAQREFDPREVGEDEAYAALVSWRKRRR